jgi:pyridoxine/pyridoxamine 5'-phosphate oxidase
MSTGHGPAPSIDFDHPPADPLPLLERWLEDAKALPTPNPNAMTLATVDADGTPSARIVLLRGLGREGARFFTNRNSRKGKALAANARRPALPLGSPRPPGAHRGAGFARHRRGERRVLHAPTRR